MTNALVIGASGGIGTALAAALEGQGRAVTRLSRADGLDLRDPDATGRALDALDGPFERILLATGILAPSGRSPEKSLARIDAAAMAEVLAVNTIGTALVLRALPRLLARDGAGKVGVLTARVGSIGDNRLGGWHAYRASKAAANMLIRGAAIELARSHKGVTCVALHPGTVATDFTAGYPAHAKHGPEQAARALLDVLDGLGPDESGGFFDYAGRPVPW
ncbi:hypothetical protein OG2516_13374 [Oceanicola granulosus HTCC2516]|uniref:C factor, cell signaling protein n=1 Tax=Oceanicola granulosus (strain ATCC BAA-861 / DSM 15982 / KCTC 12143 / HTCC2516) TaxID=314256 RepID=Q2CGZ3_OCEGH|nr:SDR family NAD(P)-dependent oxidoreductase [Oceanicola granulosus]EAR52018.1 hypothetical protein OG2516_13374 [Oceanicola granulosus HTCC2516]